MKLKEAVTPRVQSTTNVTTFILSISDRSIEIHTHCGVSSLIHDPHWFFSTPPSPLCPILSEVFFFTCNFAPLLVLLFSPYTTSRNYSLIPGPRVGIQTNQHPSLLRIHISTPRLTLSLAYLYPQPFRHVRFIPRFCSHLLTTGIPLNSTIYICSLSWKLPYLPFPACSNMKPFFFP